MLARTFLGVDVLLDDSHEAFGRVGVGGQVEEDEERQALLRQLLGVLERDLTHLDTHTEVS